MLTVGTTNASVRAAWIIDTLKKIPEGLTLLDAGAGISPYRANCTHLKYIAQDFGQYDGKGEIGLQTGQWDNSKLDIVSDIASIPLGDQSVDAIMCTEVFEHISNPLEALKEFSRLLKPGGYLILTSPFCSLTHFAPYHFYTGFSRFFYEKVLPEHGFEIEELTSNGNYFEYMGQEVRRIYSMANKYAGVKISILEKLFLRGALWSLQRISKKDKNSSELLCYGFHVLARKSQPGKS